MLPDKQLSLNVLFQSTKYGKKELCVDDKVREIIGDVYCPTCPKCVYLSTNKTTSFYDCKIAKPVATFWIFLLRTRNRQLCCKKDESRLRKTVSIFEEIPPPITTKHIRTWTKKGQIKSKYGINVSVSYWLMIWAANSFFKSFYSISIYSQPFKLSLSTYAKSSWSSQSPATESSGLSILDPTLLLLQ